MPSRSVLSLALLTCAALSLMLTASAEARPEAPSILCRTFPDAADCLGRTAECTTCHTATWPPAWNAYGLEVWGALGADFAATLPDALLATAESDADGDGATNLSELLAGGEPGDATSVVLSCGPGQPVSSELPVTAGYDFERAFRRVHVLYCGASPTYEEREAFRAVPEEEQYVRLHATLTDCLASTYWRDVGLPRIADPRIRPIGAVGLESPVDIVIGDYNWDYRLWSYVLTGDRDVRDLLLADYHVQRTDDGSLVPVAGSFDSPRGPSSAGGQPLVVERRAGMITTQWFLSINTMFSPLPRTTAAQAYRAYLGADLAQSQGIAPVAGEPLDIDRKGVAEPACAICHSTLDPLSYAFAEYEGIAGARTGSYIPGRPADEIDGWNNPTTVVLGRPVADVRGWAEVAVASEFFARNLVETFFRHALEREPTPRDVRDLEPVWRSLERDGWTASGMLHRLVDTDAFGGVQ
ncbi:MAG: DUF1585 domain-containing protein [Myxococcota bacterium]